VSAAVLDCDGNSIEVVYHSAELYRNSPVQGTRYLTNGDDSKSLVSARSSVAKSTCSASTITASTARQSQARALSSRSRSSPSVMSANKAGTEVSASTVLETLQRSLTGGVSGSAASLLGDSKIQISTKAFAGTLLGAAAGAAMAYAMCKSEEESAHAEEEASIVAHRRHLMSANQPLLLPGTPSNTPATSVVSRGSHKAGIRALGATQPISPDAYALVGYPGINPITYNAFASGTNIALSNAHSPVRSARRVVPSIYEISAGQDPLHRLITNSSSRSTASKAPSQARSTAESRAPSDHSHRSSSSKKADKSHSSKRSKAPSKVLSSVPEDELPPLPTTGHSVYDDDLGSVAPTDSISNAGSRSRSRSRRHSKERHSSSSKSESKRSSRKGESKSKSRTQSDSGETVTPSRYKGRSATDLPIR
jgi:hypothetical protein